MWIKRHWPMLLAVLANLPSLWRGLVWAFDWGSRVDFAVTKARDIGRIGVVIELFLNPPPWLIFPALLGGVISCLCGTVEGIESTTINGSQDLQNRNNTFVDSHPIAICPRIHCESGV